MAETINLGNKVVVSDPCYEIPTWCQIILRDVKPGVYYPFHKKTNLNGWGVRSSKVCVIHEDHLKSNLKWTEHNGIVGVDSGQAGIFSFDTYRLDGMEIETPVDELNPFTIQKYDDGDDWYEKMCRLTLSEDSWGTYSEGVVSSSGIGDGSYYLYTAEVNDQVVGICIDFNIERKNLNWWKKSILIES